MSTDGPDLEAFLEPLEGSLIVREPPFGRPRAVYQLAPAWATAIACYSCQYVGLILSLPARAFTWTCPRCRAGVALDPPAAVLFAPRPADGSRASRLS